MHMCVTIRDIHTECEHMYVAENDVLLYKTVATVLVGTLPFTRRIKSNLFMHLFVSLALAETGGPTQHGPVRGLSDPGKC